MLSIVHNTRSPVLTKATFDLFSLELFESRERGFNSLAKQKTWEAHCLQQHAPLLCCALGSCVGDMSRVLNEKMGKISVS